MADTEFYNTLAKVSNGLYLIYFIQCVSVDFCRVKLCVNQKCENMPNIYITLASNYLKSMLQQC